MDQPYYLYHYLTHPILYNHPIITPRQTIEKITKITPKDIQLLAQKIFRKNNANLAIVSSIKNKSPFNKVLNSL
jgi:predicted Zn-dependent peptidase